MSAFELCSGSEVPASAVLSGATSISCGASGTALASADALGVGVADNSVLGSALAVASTVGSGEDDGAGVSSARTLMPLNSISADKKAAVNL